MVLQFHCTLLLVSLPFSFPEWFFLSVYFRVWRGFMYDYGWVETGAGQNMARHHHPGLSVQVISVSKQKHSAKPLVWNHSSILSLYFLLALLHYYTKPSVSLSLFSLLGRISFIMLEWPWVSGGERVTVLQARL